MSNRKDTNKPNTRKTRGKGKVVVQLFILLILLAVIFGMLYFYQTYGKTILKLQSQAKQSVSSSTEDTFRTLQTSLVYDVEGKLISSLKAEKDVYYLEYKDIPTIVVEAMMVSEDKKFLKHDGVDYWANIRAVIALIRHKGEITQGASTITQQLARNVFLTQEVTYERKLEEIFVAQELERKYTKSDIMEFYLNEIYFANGHYGIQAAAQSYFGTGIANLSLSQAAFLCAIPNNPNLYNPLTNMENTLKRRDRILVQLLQDEKITLEQYESAINEAIELTQEKADRKNYVETYTYYCAIRAFMQQGFTFRSQFDNEEDRKAYEAAYDELYNQYQKDLYRNGYRIYTSIDLQKQEILQASVDSALADFKEVNKEGVYQMQGAAACIDNDSGKIVAIVGGREQGLKGYTLNRGYQSFRQPGSAIKPLIVYTPAFENGYTPDSIVTDRKEEGGPKNSDGSYQGKIKLQRAVELSKNTVAWKLFEEITPEAGLSFLLDMNFMKISTKDYVPAASLGGLTVGASPVEMAAAFSTLENDGEYRAPTCIVKITDAKGNEIIGEATDTKIIYEKKAARMMTEVLTGVMKNGTGKGLGLSNTMSAGKTGTTNDKKDGWFVGYTRYYTTSVWVGYDMPKTVPDLKGATYPGTIWHDYMEKIHDASMSREFELYDWRSEIKRTKDAEDEIKEIEEIEEIPQEMQDQDNEEGLITEEEITDINEEDPPGIELEEGEENSSEEEDNFPEEEENPLEEEDNEEHPEDASENNSENNSEGEFSEEESEEDDSKGEMPEEEVDNPDMDIEENTSQ